MSTFPDTIPTKSAQWATMCHDRSPEFKVHSGKGLASSAIANKKPYTPIALYEMKEGTWTKVWEYQCPEVCGCGRRYDDAVDKPWRRGKYNISPSWEGTIKDAPVICRVCYMEEESARRKKQTDEQERRELERLISKHGQPDIRARVNFGGLENLTKKD